MIIIQGICKGVVDKGEADKRWAIVGIESTSVDRDGFEQTELVKVRVFGDQIKEGYHNAYRQLQGVDVYMPVNVTFDVKYSNLSYSLVGLPVRLQKIPPAQQKAV